MSMIHCNCSCGRNGCTVAALVASAIIGVLAAFFQITEAIAVTPGFLWVALGIAVVYLGFQVATARLRTVQQSNCLCTAQSAVLAGILGTVLLAVVLLAFGTAAGVVSAILVGLLLFFFSLTLTGTACLVRCLADCAD